ncbi:Fis family transcriptional regulator [Infirmifilum lucidum]|uniref:Fis family transcriptional regulator n=1 Tax=Infirmifilum lucidum TaxID=2776706 RepID=A0A7L9FI42_9CREN|nr:DHHA1 domain-containing protein [Infirmifilum lucidum]QOJ79419.1 Fis family transcriptional regulator [Infirmifilum lucidum]
MRATLLYKLYLIARAKLEGRRIALVDEGDPDGIVSGALFRMKYPDGVVVLAYPTEAQKSVLIRSVKWDFVADLPCPGRAVLRADHHLTNPPCAEREFYDPSAPASAVLALKALELDGNAAASKLASLAVETDTANIVSQEAMELEAAVKGADYRGKLYLIALLAARGLEALKDERIRGFIERYGKSRGKTEEVAKALSPPPREAIVIFTRDERIAYRYLTILLEKAGAEFTFVLVPKGFFKYRVYVGARPSSKYNAASIASRLGGGGHKYAAGATFRALGIKGALEKVLPVLKEELNSNEIEAVVVSNGNMRKSIL